jgi:hypothetical protein
MKNINLRVLLSTVCVVSVLAGFTKVSAGPVRFDQVIQIVNAKPGKASTGMFSRIAVAGDHSFILISDNDDDKKKKPQDGRVITETKTEITDDDSCDCPEEIVEHRGFPKWALLGLAAIPIAFIIIKRKRDTPTPTPSIPITQTPTATPSMTPTPTPTPPMTPSPTPPEPVPEPMTILLFGTGLASIGLAARRRFGKRDEDGREEDSE